LFKVNQQILLAYLFIALSLRASAGGEGMAQCG